MAQQPPYRQHSYGQPQPQQLQQRPNNWTPVQNYGLPQQGQWVSSHQHPPQWTTSSMPSKGRLSLLIAGLTLFWVMALCSFSQSGDYTSLTVISLIIVGIIAAALIRYDRKKQKELKKVWTQIAWQQQEQARWAWQQMEWERQNRGQMEWERMMRERQSRERIERERREWERQNQERIERQHRERLKQAQSLEAILKLSPHDFEKLTGELLQSWGYQNVKQVGGSGDLGVDLTAQNQQGELVVVQCKRYTPKKSISSPEIQKFIGMMQVHHRTRHGIFVTTSTYTQPAVKLAKQHSIMLIDGVKLVQSVQNIFVP